MRLKCYLGLFQLMFVLMANAQTLPDTVFITDYIKSDLDSQYTSLSNTNIKLMLPQHYMLITQGPEQIYVHTGTASSIVWQKMDSVAFVSVTSTLNQETFIKQGFTLKEQFDLKTIEGRPAKVFRLSFTVDNVPMTRLIFFTGDIQTTIMLTANYPDVFAELLQNVMIASFSTLRF